MKQIICILSFLLVNQLAPCFAMPVKDSMQHRYFRSISIAQGLSQSTVFTITQDKLGFIWMGTQDGLNRYDGKTFTVYRPSRTDTSSIQSNFIRCSFIDKTGNLWIGGEKGISKYNYDTDNFTNYQLSKYSGRSALTTITQDSRSTIWTGSSDGNIFFQHRPGQSFQRLNFAALDLNIKQVTTLIYFADNIWIGTDIGLFRFNPTTSGKIKQIEPGIIQAPINCLFAEGNNLWIGTEGNGLYRYSLFSHDIINIRHNRHSTISIADDYVRSINKDSNGDIWIGTFRGLSILKQRTNSTQNYYHSPGIPHTLSQNSIRCIFIDNQKGIWLGTYYGGANYYHESDFKFGLLDRQTTPLALNDEVVNVLAEDKNGNIWIGTNDKGLNFWNRSNNSIQYFIHKESGRRNINSNNIKAIAFDKSGKLLIGTHNSGLNYFDPRTGVNKIFKHIPNDPVAISGNMVYSILVDKSNRIWIGTRSGLDKFDSHTGKFQHFYIDRKGNRLTSDEITCIIQDTKGRIWIGTVNGVNIFYPDNILFENFEGQQLSNDVVNTIAEDAYGHIWIGTRGGLNLFDEKNGKFISSPLWTALSGVIYAIVPDDNGMLWVSTNTGLVKFNSNTNKIQLFNYRYGLQTNQFNINSSLKTHEGQILFGGINGVTFFFPSEIKQKPSDLKIVFTQLDVLNRQVVPGDSLNILNTHIDRAEKIKLVHDLKQFTIYFSAFNFVSPEEVNYQTILFGNSKEWQTSSNNFVSYSHLSPGKYQLQVRAVSTLGEIGTIRKIEIEILPPWWKTSWFYLLWFLVTTSIFFLAYKIISDRIKTHHELKVERIGKERMKYINKMKMEFLTNVSHELKTPLTLILAPIEEIIKHPKTEKELKKAHQLILFNTRRLNRLMDQLLDFRKTELGIKKLVVTRQNIICVIRDIYNSFQPVAEKQNINLQFHSSEKNIYFFFDKDSIEKILFNLLSNAFKYTGKNGLVSVTIKKEEDNIIIVVADTGIGIEVSKQNDIFRRFYQVNNNEINLGSGIGLAYTKSLVQLHHGKIWVESNLGTGSRFFVSIPIKDEYYEADHHSNSDKDKLMLKPNIQQNKLLQYNPEEEYISDKQPELTETILIIDDNHEIVEYLTSYFSKAYNIKNAFDGFEGLKIVLETQVDIVICDVMMPDMDGIQFCKRIKKNINLSHIPVILLTAKDDLADHIHGLETGADDYISKPFSIHLLQIKIQNILRTRKLLREYYSQTSEIIAGDITFNNLDKEFIAKAIKIVEDNITETDLSVDKLSKELFMSRSNLYLKLKAITGASASDFIKRIRFKKAVELLQTQKYSMSEVAYRTGFSSPSYFSTAFKQHFKCLPSEYLAKSSK